MSDFNEHLRKIRREKGFTQRKLSAALEVSRSTVAMWEIGEREPSLDMILQISDLLRVPYTDLIGPVRQYVSG